MKISMLAGAAAAAAFLTASPAAHAAPYDGRWSVTIVTQKGTCDRAYNYMVGVQNGIVTYLGQTSVQVTGRVQNSGQVNVRVALGQHSATGVGRLSARAGSGVWRDASNSCSGTWKAFRQRA